VKRPLDGGLARRTPDRAETAALLARQRQCDAEARRKAHELLASVHRWLWKLAYRWAHYAPKGMVADDLFQEFAMWVIRYAHTHRPERCKATTWAFYVCRKVMQRHRLHQNALKRRGAVVSIFAGTDGCTVLDSLGSRRDEPSAAVIDREEAGVRRQRISLALGKLPPLQRFAIEGSYGLGDGHSYTCRELAVVLGCSHQNANDFRVRGLANISTALKGGVS
jgi:RNA polymerase sigma factor (sigma-70 family)